MRAISTVGICALLTAALGCSFSGAKAAAHPPTIDEFVKQYVAAVNARDLAAYRSLLNSNSLACVNAESNDFYDRAFQSDLRHPVPAGYKFAPKRSARMTNSRSKDMPCFLFARRSRCRLTIRKGWKTRVSYSSG